MFSIGQAAAGTVASTLCPIPAGPCMVSVQSDSASANTAYVGISAAGGTVTTANGYPIPAGGNLVFARYLSEGSATLTVITSGTATLGWLVSGR
jgi:hypothetical protein